MDIPDESGQTAIAKTCRHKISLRLQSFQHPPEKVSKDFLKRSPPCIHLDVPHTVGESPGRAPMPLFYRRRWSCLPRPKTKPDSNRPVSAASCRASVPASGECIRLRPAPWLSSLSSSRDAGRVQRIGMSRFRGLPLCSSRRLSLGKFFPDGVYFSVRSLSPTSFGHDSRLYKRTVILIHGSMRYLFRPPFSRQQIFASAFPRSFLVGYIRQPLR